MSDYILLTPGPLTTSQAVKETMLNDWSTWDVDYNETTQWIRRELLRIAHVSEEDYTAVLIQGSGSYGIESVINTGITAEDTILVLENGAYGRRMAQMAKGYGINTLELTFAEDQPVDANQVAAFLELHPEVTHLGMVHLETTTGILNPVSEVLVDAHERGIETIVDAMSSFGGMPIDVAAWNPSYLVSSANKAIQGVPGFAFVIAKREVLNQHSTTARSLSLDLYDQNHEMDTHNGKWRFTSPTHVVYAFAKALEELRAEGGVAARYARYANNQQKLERGMHALGFKTILADDVQSPIITSYMFPTADFDFQRFYDYLKAKRFVIYPGKVSKLPTFRLGNIGEIYDADIDELLTAIAGYDILPIPVLADFKTITD
ncbi:2-aminoethylphosphonate--pyruvate transaminase [Periweissella cryptocerci]|uniref:2-aminoethylphosphonate--pyruvate transaminase n=2 Tax=Periweissella cryptocerci TaxID=2506420 RepID=A0A4P6YV04_9LACO|nr:2-aminoethylphosphonate--pyruvate transaminase [Periweissella cryptocerci]QBO36634.1 2-aminoethylphosphonate--pyruvate transaminase [Periweissella cryptocerci]